MPPAPLPSEIAKMEAARVMRMHHMLWHTARNGWLRFSAQTQQAFEDAGWAPPRPAVDAQGNPILDNHSGEDFLFMHRQMIAAVNDRLAVIEDPDYPKVQGWARFPRPGDADYPVPPAYAMGDPDADASLVRLKSDDFFTTRFAPKEGELTDHDFLTSTGLGELGASIEFTVHNWAHQRWSQEPAEQRPPGLSPPPSFDDVSYDWLADFYSSHVNATFWKLHGWVDAQVDAWMRANDEVAATYEWTGTWIGPVELLDEHGPHAGPAALGAPPAQQPAQEADDAERLLALAADEGLEASPRDVEP